MAAIADSRAETAPQADHPASHAWREVLARVAAHMAHCGAHPARTVVLVPFAQLMAEAAAQWARLYPSGFAPRFETTRNWASQVGSLTPGPSDLALERGRDLLTARSLLEGAGLGAQHALLAGPLVDGATQLAAVAASVPQALRADWGDLARRALPNEAQGWLALEAAVARIAIAWAAHSDYATDVLFADRVRQGTDALVLLQGLQSEPLAGHLLEHFSPEKALAIDLRVGTAPGEVLWHRAEGSDDEAGRAAACVLRHIEAGRAPVALVAGDRLLTRRIRALLGPDVAVRDETGWKLSTTHAAAQLMAALRACAREAGSDAVLDWLKQCPGAVAWPAADVALLERSLRRHGLRRWPDAQRLPAMTADDEAAARLAALVAAIDAERAALQAPRPVTAWLEALAGLLRASGLWEGLQADLAGQKVLQALDLLAPAAIELEAPAAAARPLRLPEFTTWVDEVLEAASFVPPHPPTPQVVIAPLHQLLARPFPAVVLPGADADRLPAAPEPPGPFSNAQRAQLGLPTREELGHAQGAALAQALHAPRIDVLWRARDGGEDQQPSPMLQLHWLERERRGRFLVALPGEKEEERRLPPLAPDPRVPRAVPAAPTPRPAPDGRALAVAQLSASGYEALRACPYRFFALQQLRLQESPEIDVDVDKRDFGTWLHRTLQLFHTGLAESPEADEGARRARLDACADQAARELALPADEFLPFQALWPELRDGYLKWLAGHEAAGARFEDGEVDRQVRLGPVTLRGRLDRIDRLADGRALVLDYKTERQERTKQRIKVGTEDTQLPFYAALLEDDTLAAAYLNLGEREPAKAFAQEHVVVLRDELVHGILDDMAQIAAGAPLPALGEGQACTWCEARGLCRRDFWSP
ncbi:MAG: PD-(D/E)XK nuclease family protein [Burkholderiaceae bacterium]